MSDDKDLGLTPDGTYTPVRNRKVNATSDRVVYDSVPIEDVKISETDPSRPGHVFISYDWSDKEIVFEIWHRLQNEGYTVKIDEDPEGSDMLEGLAEAVEKADVVIICISQKYRSNRNCEAEAKYANQLRKKLIALKMQSDYKAEGWLGLIVAGKYNLNFSNPSTFEASIPKLVKELGEDGKNAAQEGSGQLTAPKANKVFDYLSNPFEITHNMEPGKLLRGITVLYDEVFIVREETPELEVYDPNTLTLVRRTPVESLSAPRDIDASTKYSCLYIVNFDLNCMHRVELGGNITRWPLNDKPRGISVTRDGYNVVVAFAETRRLRQYSTHGDLIRDITLQDDILHPFQGIQMPSGQFVVCHGCSHSGNQLHRVCLVGVDGCIAGQRYGGEPGSQPGHVYIPERMDVDKTDASIVVHEVQNQRVMMFNSDLTETKVLIQPRKGRDDWDIRRISLDEARGRLYLIEWEMVGGAYVDSELCIFQVKTSK